MMTASASCWSAMPSVYGRYLTDSKSTTNLSRVRGGEPTKEAPGEQLPKVPERPTQAWLKARGA